MAADRLGVFNLNIKAHGWCVKHTMGYKVPLMVLGGGGYIPRNVARCWAYETALCIGADDINSNLPDHTPFLEHFAPDRSLFPALTELTPKKFTNSNSPSYIKELVANITEQLRYIEGAPSVQMTQMPPNVGELREEMERVARDAGG